jgi:hypothetical protein
LKRSLKDSEFILAPLKNSKRRPGVTMR